MARNPLIRKIPNTSKSHNQGHKSAGILDDYAIRKVINSKEGTVEKVPVNDSDIANKKYIDAQFPVTHASTTGKTTDDHHPQTNTIVSHDTSATGAELDTLTDNSIANTLHRHSELVASDGSPDPALSVDALGQVGIGTTTPDRLLTVKTGAENNEGIVIQDSDGVGKSYFILGNPGGSRFGRIQLLDHNNIFQVSVSTVGDSWFNGGNIGVGTNSPSKKLTVQVGALNDDGIIIKDELGATKTDLSLGNPTGNRFGRIKLYDHLGNLDVEINPSSSTYFNGGNVGIGTASPTEKLHIIGNSLVTGNSTVQGTRNQKYYAEGYVSSALVSVIHTQSEWHPVRGLTPGEISDWTVDAGETGSITQIVQNGPDITITANNTMSIGDTVGLVGSTGYDSLYVITAVTATTFDVTAAYVADGTGTYIKGDTFICPADGIYNLQASVSGQPVTATPAPTYEFSVSVNAVVFDRGRPQRKFSNATDTGSFSGGGMLSLSTGDKIQLSFRNNTGVDNFTFEQLNITMVRF